MRRLALLIIPLLTMFIIAIVFIFYMKENKSHITFGLEEFENSMKEKGYHYELQDVPQDFLPTTRKRMIIDDISIDIYLFNDRDRMETEAGKIESHGYGYRNDTMSIKVSWVSYPHFYKKGKLIVQYIGINESIISDLEDILGKQFAGYTL
jgi:hypothetical protein